MPLLVVALFLVAFGVNVAIGATGGKVFLTDVQEMLVLMGASIAFVVAILKKESQRNRRKEGAAAARED